MTFSFICHMIATLIAVVAVILVVTEETLASLDALEMFVFSFLFHTLGHWIPGGTH